VHSTPINLFITLAALLLLAADLERAVGLWIFALIVSLGVLGILNLYVSCCAQCTQALVISYPLVLTSIRCSVRVCCWWAPACLISVGMSVVGSL